MIPPNIGDDGIPCDPHKRVPSPVELLLSDLVSRTFPQRYVLVLGIRKGTGDLPTPEQVEGQAVLGAGLRDILPLIIWASGQGVDEAVYGRAVGIAQSIPRPQPGSIQTAQRSLRVNSLSRSPLMGIPERILSPGMVIGLLSRL